MIGNNCSKINICPAPAYGTTRYSGATDFKLHQNKRVQIFNSPRNAAPKYPSPFTRSNIWSKKLGGEKTRDKRDDSCDTSTESSFLSICGSSSDTSSHCTCESETQLDERCNCCSKDREDGSELTCETSLDNCVDMKKIYKLTDTSNTKFVESYERLVNCLKMDEEANLYNIDLFDPHPREIRQIAGKNSPPTGYDISLVLPQCICLADVGEHYKKIEKNESLKSVCDEKSESLSTLICVPSMIELSWDVLQLGMIEEIPEKYTTSLFLEKKNGSVCVSDKCFELEKNIRENTDSQKNICSHKAFLQKINESLFSLQKKIV